MLNTVHYTLNHSMHHQSEQYTILYVTFCYNSTLDHTVLNILYLRILHWTALHYPMLCLAVLCNALLSWTRLYCTILSYTTLCYAMLDMIVHIYIHTWLVRKAAKGSLDTRTLCLSRSKVHPNVILLLALDYVFQHTRLPTWIFTFLQPRNNIKQTRRHDCFALFVTFICMRLASVGNTVVPFLHFSHGKLTRAFVFFRLRLLPYSPQSTYHYKDGSRWKRCCWVRGGWRNWRRWRPTLELFPDTINRYVTCMMLYIWLYNTI